MIARDRGIAALQFAGDLLYHQCSIFLPSLGPIQAVGRGERSQCVGSWMGCVAEVAEPRASPCHRPVGLAPRHIRLWALSHSSAHIRVCCRTCSASASSPPPVLHQPPFPWPIPAALTSQPLRAMSDASVLVNAPLLHDVLCVRCAPTPSYTLASPYACVCVQLCTCYFTCIRIRL